LASRRAFDIVHLAHTTFPEDPRPRREAMIAAETGARVAIIVAQGGRDARRVSRYGPLTVVRLDSSRQRGSAASYLIEYFEFLHKARVLIKRDPRFHQARVFHVHTLPDFLVAATRLPRRRGARVVLDLHELFPEFTRSKFSGWKGNLGERVARIAERWSRRQADEVLTVNHAVADQLKRRPARTGEMIHVIHNFADPGEFGPALLTTGAAGPPLRLVYHGTLTPLYGLDIAIDAVSQARAAGLMLEFDIYGSGPAAGALEQQIGHVGAAGFIRLKGSASHDQLRHLLPSYHAGLVPTRLDGMTRFSLSTKLLEYIHLGIPVILPSIPTYIRYFPAESAWYFTPNDSRSLMSALETFARAKPDERVKRAAAAQAASRRELDAEHDAALLRDLYTRLLAQVTLQPR
jgi:glycosyltransferase involved in cell wall biosynthesis